MQPDAVLIQTPAVNFATFLSLGHKAVGYSLSSAVDAKRNASDAERFLSCLASLLDREAAAGLLTSLLPHVSYSAFIAADERDLLDILQTAAGMPFVAADTVARGVQVAVVTGTLAQWRDAVIQGASPGTELNVRACFCKLKGLFESAGLNVWQGLPVRHLSDNTFVIEHKK
jgi:hypothetical protein